MTIVTRLAGAAAAVAAASIAFSAPSSAGDRDMKRWKKFHEKPEVTAALRDQGFLSWDHIKWDDGIWKIDDARRDDGKKYDVVLHPKTLEVINARLD
jgi:hypothetical protein